MYPVVVKIFVILWFGTAWVNFAYPSSCEECHTIPTGKRVCSAVIVVLGVIVWMRISH